MKFSYDIFSKSLKTLHKAASETNITDYVKDATIQRFEYTYEAAWKAIKFVLESKGVFLTFPSDLFREAFSNGWLLDAKIGKEMIDARNSTSHQYNENSAEKIYLDICSKYYPELNYLKIQLGRVIDGEPTS